MEIIYLMITVSLILALLFLGAYIWSIKSGQTADLESPAMRILIDTKPKNKIS